MARPYKVLLRAYEEKARTRLKEDLGELLGVGAGYADDILASVPIVLFDNLSKKEAEKVVEKIKKAIEGSAELVSTRESLTDVARVEWPELPQVVKDVLIAEDEEKKEAVKEKKAEGKPKEKKKRRRKAAREDIEAAEGAEKEEVVVRKYDFTVDQIEVENRWVFCCPRCGAMFQLVPLTEEERQEALAQKEIEKILGKRETAISPATADAEGAEGKKERKMKMIEPLGESPVVGEEPLAVPLAEEPAVKDDFSVTMDELERHAEEVYTERTEQEQLPMVEPATPAEELPVPEEVTDKAEGAPFSEEKSVSEAEESIVGEEADVVKRLQSLPQEEQPPVLKQPEAPLVEEVPPEEVLKLLKTRKKGTTSREKERVEKLRKAPATKRDVRPTKSATTVHNRKALTRPEAPESEKEKTTGKAGGCVVVLSTVSIQADPQKLSAAAEIVAQVTGAGVDDVRAALRNRPIITVVRGVTREKAEEIQQKFRSAGITVRVTEPRSRPHR